MPKYLKKDRKTVNNYWHFVLFMVSLNLQVVNTGNIGCMPQVN
jgi:hypothetical protein